MFNVSMFECGGVHGIDDLGPVQAPRAQSIVDIDVEGEV